MLPNPCDVFDVLYDTPLTPGGEAWKRLAKSFGPLDPMGDKDAKTRSPGTYRPVGATCSTGCPHLATRDCYALYHNVGTHQRNASEDRDQALRTAAAAMAWAHRTDRLTRLHVSGDLARDDRLDREYVAGLIRLAHHVRERTGSRWVAWTYTHCPDLGWEAPAMRAAGIAIRQSDVPGRWGAIVHPFERVDTLRREGVRYLKCPAQLSDTDCSRCRACWEHGEHTIVFDPHGSAQKRLRTRLLEVIQ